MKRIYTFSAILLVVALVIAACVAAPQEAPVARSFGVPGDTDLTNLVLNGQIQVLPTAATTATPAAYINNNNVSGDSLVIAAAATPVFSVNKAGAVSVGGNMIFEGATVDEYETTFAITDPTSSDKTITFPNSSGTVALNPYGASIEFEGATADEYELTLTVVDPTTPDKTVTIPNETGAVMLSSLTTNATDAANSVTGASNGLVFEGATANEFETTIAPTNPTADRTLTLPDASGTVALTSQGVDMTLTADTTGGNAGAKTEYIGLPRVKLIGGGAGTNPNSQTISLFDDTPDGEWGPVTGTVTETLNAVYYKHGTKSYGVQWGAEAVATDGIKDPALGANAAWDDMESFGILVYSTATWASGDLTLVLTDNGGARTFSIPALTEINKWVWLEVNIGTGDLSTISDVAILMSAQGETALGAFQMYIDIAYVWDDADEEALGVAIQQDGILGVINTVTGAPLVELTDYIIHYEDGPDFLVYVSDQSTAGIAVLAAY